MADPSVQVAPMLRTAEALYASGIAVDELDREYQSLSDRYRAEGRTPRTISGSSLAAYVVARLPATLAVNVEVLAQLARARRDLRPRSVLDVGAGVGPSGWAAVATFPSVERVTHRDAAPGMVAAGEALAARSDLGAVREGRWQQGEATDGLDRADLVVASYLLGEVTAEAAAVEAWWRATDDTLLIIEPGTPDGYARILRARAVAIGLGARVAAPCPHELACPLAGGGAVPGDWCHFSVRVNRSRLHRMTKHATLSSEDEKFSYVALTRTDGVVRGARVLRKPTKRAGHVRLDLCTSAGLAERVVARSDADYATARKLRWGDALVAAE